MTPALQVQAQAADVLTRAATPADHMPTLPCGVIRTAFLKATGSAALAVGDAVGQWIDVVNGALVTIVDRLMSVKIMPTGDTVFHTSLTPRIAVPFHVKEGL